MPRTARHAAILTALLLSSCGDQRNRDEVGPSNSALQEYARGEVPVRTPLPAPPPPPPAPAPGGLLPLSRSDIESGLPPGAGCSLDDSARGPLLVAVAEGAIVNDSGRIVRLEADARNLQELSKGGRFVGKGLVVEVRRGQPIEQVDEVTTWDASLGVTRNRLGFMSFHHRWTCGA